MPQAESSQPILVNPWRVFVFEALMFSPVLVLGLASGWKMMELFKAEDFLPPAVSIWGIFLALIMGTAALLIVVYFFKFQRWKGRFFRAILFITVLFGNLTFFTLWLPGLFGLLPVILLSFLFFRKRLVIWHDAALIFAMAGVGAGFGVQMDPLTVIIMLLAFSLYDFLAVYATKHMIAMAKTMIVSEAVVGLIIPKTASDFKSSVEGIKQEGRFMILGGGDIVFPLILAVSCLKISWLFASVVSIFALLGIFFVFYIFTSQKDKRPLPALPPIALMSAAGYFLAKILC